MGTSRLWRTATARTAWIGSAVVAAVTVGWLSTRVIAGAQPAAAVIIGCADVARFVTPGESLDILTQCFKEDSDYRLLSLSIVTAPTQGTASVLDYGHVRYVANQAASGSDSFTIRVSDPLGAMSDPATISITFAANQSPSCPDINTYAADRVVAVACADPDGDFLTTVTIMSPPAQGTLVAQVSPGYDYAHTGDVTFYYTPFPTATGTDSFTYTVTDQRGGTSPVADGTISLDNRPPSASGGSTVLLPGETRTFTACHVDPDRDVLTATVLAPPSKGSVIVSAPSLVPHIQYTANAGASGSDSFTARCDDGRGGVSNVGTFNVQINAGNSPPVCRHNNPLTLGTDPRLVETGNSVDIDVACQDPDGQPASNFALVSPPSKGTVTAIDPTGNGFRAFRYTANAGESGSDSFTFTGTDSEGATSAPATVNITIVACPLQTLRFRHTMEVWYGSSFQGATKLRDGVQLSDFITGGIQVNLLSDATLDPRVVAGMPDPYPWVNPAGLTNIEWVLETPQNLPAEANLRAALAEGLTVPTFDSPINAGSRSILIDSFVITQPCGTELTQEVPVEFFVDVSLFELNAREGNRVPACSNLTGNVNAGAAVEVAPSCTDADGHALTYAIGSQGAKGTASIVSGQLHYVANAGTSGTDTFTYTANDGNGGTSSPATVTITITGSSGCQLGSTGCTAGYWKTNAQKSGASAWPAGLTPSTPLSAVFAVPSCVGASLGNATLLQALSFSSGKTLSLAAQNLLRQASSSVLNASSTCVQYGLCKADVVSRTNAALASCDRAGITNLATQFESLNSANCPLNQQGICRIPR